MAAIQLVRPSLAHLPDYTIALERGWSPNTARDVSGLQLTIIRRDAKEFLHELLRQDGPFPWGIDNTPRLRHHTFWMWDGDFCGAINFRFQPGTEDLPPHCSGHIGYAVVPEKRGRGYAKVALAHILPVARAERFSRVMITCDADNAISRRVIEANGGVPTPSREAGKLYFWVLTSA
jgi:predicted acetyltransferase